MHKGSTLLLKFLVILAGIGVLSFFVLVIPDELLSEAPKEIHPFIFVMYLSTLPFFFALYQTMKLIKYVDENIAFSEDSVKTLKMIKYSSIAFSLLYIIILPYLFLLAQLDDAPGVAAIGMVCVFGSLMFGTFAAVLQRLVQNGIDLKSENDLTV